MTDSLARLSPLGTRTAHDGASAPPGVSLVRLYVLRATYLLLVVGLGLDIWPLLLQQTPNVEHMRGVVWSILGSVALLALLGIRHPLRMLPLLFFELVWKTVWVLAIGLPRWSAGTLDGPMHDTWFACLMGIVVFPLAIPWGYVLQVWVRAPGERWRRR